LIEGSTPPLLSLDDCSQRQGRHIYREIRGWPRPPAWHWSRAWLDQRSCPVCMARLHFASEGCCRKSLICIRPTDRLAGRGLDGSTRAPLTSFSDRLSSNQTGHQVQGASIDPFHASPQSRTRSRRRLDRRGLEVGIEGFAVAQHAPGDAGELVGQRDGQFVPVQSF
jgi:hypothetical protein